LVYPRLAQQTLRYRFHYMLAFFGAAKLVEACIDAFGKPFCLR
jgi:hypothetical protein